MCSDSCTALLLGFKEQKKCNCRTTTYRYSLVYQYRHNRPNYICPITSTSCMFIIIVVAIYICVYDFYSCLVCVFIS